MNFKKIIAVLNAKETLEGAGVRLHRAFANAEVPRFDPFLLFDDFSSPDPSDYRLGFPWHPHRGIETVTYIIDGVVNHHDSLGNSGSISKGQVQWMTAGSGILHEEMPKSIPGLIGFQLWVNLPKGQKMTKPRYQDVTEKMIPEINYGDSATIRVIAGSIHETNGPVEELMAMPLYLDVKVKPNTEFMLPIPTGYNTFIYLFEGHLGNEDMIDYKVGQLLHFSLEGDAVALKSGSSGARFMLASGKPLDEPVAWRGPIVMNTSKELEQAYYDLQVGSFIKDEPIHQE